MVILNIEHSQNSWSQWNDDTCHINKNVYNETKLWVWLHVIIINWLAK